MSDCASGREEPKLAAGDDEHGLAVVVAEAAPGEDRHAVSEAEQKRRERRERRQVEAAIVAVGEPVEQVSGDRRRLRRRGLLRLLRLRGALTAGTLEEAGIVGHLSEQRLKARLLLTVEILLGAEAHEREQFFAFLDTRPVLRHACGVIVYCVVDLGLSPTFPLGDSLEVCIRREDAERFVEDVRRDAPEEAQSLRIVERELEAGGRN